MRGAAEKLRSQVAWPELHSAMRLFSCRMGRTWSVIMLPQVNLPPAPPFFTFPCPFLDC